MCIFRLYIFSFIHFWELGVICLCSAKFDESLWRSSLPSTFYPLLCCVLFLLAARKPPRGSREWAVSRAGLGVRPWWRRSAGSGTAGSSGFPFLVPSPYCRTYILPIYTYLMWKEKMLVRKMVDLSSFVWGCATFFLGVRPDMVKWARRYLDEHGSLSCETKLLREEKTKIC
jgi:hypothetical protein